MTAHSTIRLIGLLVGVVIAGGACKDLPSAVAIRQEIENELPGAHFERDSHVRLGPVALAMLRPLANWALEKDDKARLILAGIRRVDVATWEVESLPEPLAPSSLRRLENRMTAHGWVQMIREIDADDSTWIFAQHHDDGSLRGLLVVELDATELSIVAVQGRLDEVFAHAVADEPGEFADLFGS